MASSIYQEFPIDDVRPIWAGEVDGIDCVVFEHKGKLCVRNGRMFIGHRAPVGQVTEERKRAVLRAAALEALGLEG